MTEESEAATAAMPERDDDTTPGHAGLRPGADAQAERNGAVWGAGGYIGHYASRELRPAEVIFLARHRQALAGRVLEVGCGAGRLSGYLIDLAAEFHGIDIAPDMVAFCRSRYPGGTFEVRDLRDLAGLGPPDAPPFGAVVATYGVIDVLGHEERLRALSQLRALLAPGGLLMVSSHNLAYVPRLRAPTDLHARNPLRSAGRLALMPRRLRNRRRLVPLQQQGDGWAIVNDDAHEYALLHYYVSRDEQVRQLAAAGLQPLECLDHEGRAVPPGAAAGEWVELYYLAKRAD